MTLQWLGQMMQLQAGHAYQARWLVRGSSYAFPCPLSDAKVDQVETILTALGGAMPGGGGYGVPSIWEPIAVMKLPNVQVFDGLKWPAGRREVPPSQGQAGLCPIWTQSVPTSPVNIPLATIQDALGPVGGLLLDLWDNNTGQVLYERPASQPFVPGQPAPLPGGGGGGQGPLPSNLLPGGQTSPGLPPLFPVVPGGGQTSPGQPPSGGGGQTPPPSPPLTAEKKVSPLVWVLGGAVLIGAVYLITGD